MSYLSMVMLQASNPIGTVISVPAEDEETRRRQERVILGCRHDSDINLSSDSRVQRDILRKLMHHK